MTAWEIHPVDYNLGPGAILKLGRRVIASILTFNDEPLNVGYLG